MSKSKAPLYLGLTAAGGVGYYLYTAGGNPKAAEAKFESDIHKASAEAKSHLPGGRTPDAQNKGAQVGAKLDEAVAQADKKFSTTKSNVEAYAKDAKAEALKKVDAFDKKVEDEAAKAKSGISSWFGGK
ncbi:calcofluor white hypersensitive protein [Colletotrichum falcatum]|nr:calcofluor white hypersensitive protein [Colletotrichum falcatum]